MKYFKTEKETSFNEQVALDLPLGKGAQDEDPLDFPRIGYLGPGRIRIKPTW